MRCIPWEAEGQLACLRVRPGVLSASGDGTSCCLLPEPLLSGPFEATSASLILCGPALLFPGNPHPHEFAIAIWLQVHSPLNVRGLAVKGATAKKQRTAGARLHSRLHAERESTERESWPVWSTMRGQRRLLPQNSEGGRRPPDTHQAMHAHVQFCRTRHPSAPPLAAPQPTTRHNTSQHPFPMNLNLKGAQLHDDLPPFSLSQDACTRKSAPHNPKPRTTVEAACRQHT